MTLIKDISKTMLRYLAENVQRVMRLRVRYVLNRHDRIRLRYVVPFFVCLIGALSYFVVAHIDFSSSQAAKEKSLDSLLAQGMNEGLDPASGVGASVGANEATALARQLEDHDYVREAALKAQRTARLKKQPKEEIITISKGGTLSGALGNAGFTAAQSLEIVEGLEDSYDPRSIRAGDKIYLRYVPVDNQYKFSELVIYKTALEYVSLTPAEDGSGYVSQIKKRDVETKLYANNATIELSLFGSAAKAGFPDSVTANLIHMYSWDVDFQRDIRQGDTVEVLYEQIETKAGEKIANGNILYARLNVNGEDIPIYRYEMSNGDVDYFTPDGRSIRKALMKTPINGARLSSGFGMRKHPVLGYNKMHKGLDFAAPRGTPIYAAGDGTLEYVGRKGGYGNYIRIRHNSDIKTAYAHMKSFAKGMSTGKRVKQGQTIGYVGTTGRSTGPHLHYEVLRNGQQINPRKVKMPQGETLKGQELANFKSQMDELNTKYTGIAGKLKYAAR